MAHGNQPAAAVPHSRLSAVRHTEDAGRFYQNQQFQETLEACEKALAADPNFAAAYYYRGMALYRLGPHDAMFAAFDRAVECDPNNAKMLNGITKILAHLNALPKAIALLHRVIELDASIEEAWSNLAECYYRIGKADTARAMFAHAAQKFPNNKVIKLLYATLLPQILMSQAEGDQLYAGFMDSLDRLMREGFTLADPVMDMPIFPYYHAYYGLNCKPLLEKLAAFFLKACPSLQYEAPHCRVLRKREGKLRIGFVTEMMHTDTIMQFFAGILEGLAKDEELEIILFSISVSPTSKVPEIADKVHKYISLPANLPDIRSKIAQEALDVLMYLDIGIAHYAYFTAFARLAPVQCTWGGHPVTTGISAMDYFLSTSFAEADDAQAHYTEKLVLLKNPLTHFAKLDVPPQPLSRKELGMPDGMRLYACPVQLFKLHPDMDAAFTRIMEGDPMACIILFAPVLPLLRPQLEARFNKTIPPALRERIVFLPFAKKEMFLHMLRNVDAILDPFHYSFGTTAYITFSLGLPFATWPGEFLRGRVGCWMYDRMDMPEMISPTHEAYADMAIRVANDKAFRDEVSAKIRERCHPFFANDGAVTELGDCLKQLYADT